MVAHFTIRTYGVNQEFRFGEGIWLHRKSRQIGFFFGKDLFYIIRAEHVLSYHLIFSTMPDTRKSLRVAEAQTCKPLSVLLLLCVQQVLPHNV